MKILIVDTDRDWVEMLTSWFKKLGYEASHEDTGEQAKIEWEKQQPDLVILDTNLRDVDVLKVCREMRGKHEAQVLITTRDQIPILERSVWNPVLMTTFVSLSLQLNFRHISMKQWLEEEVLTLQSFLLPSSWLAPSVLIHYIYKLTLMVKRKGSPQWKACSCIFWL